MNKPVIDQIRLANGPEVQKSGDLESAEFYGKLKSNGKVIRLYYFQCIPSLDEYVEVSVFPPTSKFQQLVNKVLMRPEEKFPPLYAKKESLE